ncbi:MAG: type II toxin-antitoxin system VapC family toxin [Rhodanobacter sp.]|nr:MAG: type II toxin-antitoxin system VapC family toxin [Rhodanobacter sp.]
MNVLLDAHVFLWVVMQPSELSSKVRKLLESPATGLTVSAASAWEIATKFRLGKLPDAKPILADFDDVVGQSGARMLAVTHVHALRADKYLQPHRDPFDRMLVAQAEIEALPPVSKDRALWQFGVELLW